MLGVRLIRHSFSHLTSMRAYQLTLALIGIFLGAGFLIFVLLSVAAYAAICSLLEGVLA